MKTLICLLMLALSSARADDLQAAATPDPDDDIFAAQDNHFLAAAADAKLKTLPDAQGMMHPGLNTRVRDFWAISSATTLLSHAVPFLSLYPDRLYLLTSLQC